MGPSPPPPLSSPPLSSPLPLSHPPPPSAHFLSPASDDSWLLNPDRDTDILTQALTYELSSGNGGLMASSSVFPSASSSSSSILYKNFSNSLEGRTLHSQTSQPLLASKDLQQQQQAVHHRHHYEEQQQQQQQHHLQQPRLHQQQVVPLSSMLFRADRYSHLDQSSLQNGSPLSTTSSPRPLSAEAPPSPFSSISTERALDYSHSQHQDSQDGSFARAMAASSYKPPEISSLYSGPLISARAASMGLSSQAPVGAGASRGSKKRSRATNKAPTMMLSTDASNFRAMVQRLTGIPSSPYPLAAGIPLIKPQPIRQPWSSTSNLPTLDTSAGFLGPKYLKESFSFPQKQHQGWPYPASPSSGRSTEGVDLRRSQVASPILSDEQGSGSNNHSLLSASPGLWNTMDTLRVRSNPLSVHQGEQISARKNPSPSPSPSALDGLAMDDYLPTTRSSFNTVDSWLSFDAPPTMEIARMA